MGFGGSVSAMLASLKNNKRPRSSAFKKLKENGVEYTSRTELHFDQKSTPAQLRVIRKRIKKENRIAFVKKAIIMSILLTIIAIAIIYMKF